MGVIKLTVKLGLCLMGLWTAALWAQPSRTHTVLRKETPYGIAKQHGVDLNRLFELNPWAESGIRKGDVLVLPAAWAIEEQTPSVATPPEIRMSEEEEGAPAEAVLVAPTEVEPLLISKERVREIQTDGEAVPRGRPVPPIWPSDTLHVAVMLPFSAGEDSLSRQALRLRDIALDCAAGIRLAMDTGRWLGAHWDVRFLDSGRDTAGSLKFTPEDILFQGQPADVLVGPLRRPAFKEVGDWAEVEGAVHLMLTDLGASMVQDIPGRLFPFSSPQSRMAVLADHVASLHPGERVMMLTTGNIRNLNAEEGFRTAWKEAVKDSVSSFVEVEVTARGLGALRDSLSDVRRNILVAPGGAASRSLAGVLQTEIQLGDTMDFLLYADGSWRDFEFLDPSFCERVRLTIVDGGGARPDSVAGELLSDSAGHELERRMAVLRGDAVGKYAWLAHDLMREVMGWTAGHGRQWAARLAMGELLIRPRGMGGGLRYEFNWNAHFGPASGLANQHVRLMRQESWQWVQLNVPGHVSPNAGEFASPSIPNPKR